MGKLKRIFGLDVLSELTINSSCNMETDGTSVLKSEETPRSVKILKGEFLPSLFLLKYLGSS